MTDPSLQAFFSVIAQISFTIAGFLLVALTVSEKTRLFWFGQTPHSRYASTMLLTLLMPGFLSLAALIPIQGIWLWVFFIIAYILLLVGLYSMRREEKYKEIESIETKLDIRKTTWLHVVLLIGIIAIIWLGVSEKDFLGFNLNFLIGFLIISMVLSSITSIPALFRFDAELNQKHADLTTAEAELPVIKESDKKPKGIGVGIGFFIERD